MSRSSQNRVRFTPSDTDEWSTYFRKTPVASFFQSPAWAKIWARYSGGQYQPEPWIAVFPSGKRVLLPFSRQRLTAGLGSILHASPGGTYGGWLIGSGQTLSDNEAAMLIQEIASRFGSFVFRFFPFPDDGSMQTHSPNAKISDENYAANDSEAAVLLKKHAPGVRVITDRTHVLDCSKGYEFIRDMWAKDRASMRRKIQKAEKSGMTIRQAEGEQDLEKYYELYLENTRHWHPPPSHIYGRELFSILNATKIDGCENRNDTGLEEESSSRAVNRSDGKNKERMTAGPEIWLAEHQGKIIAGAVILRGDRHSAYWHGCSRFDARRMRPVNLLMARVIARSCELGDLWFDFNPSRNVPGVEKFKQSFGAVTAASPVITKTSGLTTLLASPKTGKLALGLSRILQKIGIRHRGFGQ